MDVTAALLDSWNRQARIVNEVAGRITEKNQNAKPSEDGWPLYHQLAHIHQVRRFFLSQLDPAASKNLGASFKNGWNNPVDDIANLQEMLRLSGAAVHDVVKSAIESGQEKSGFYENPVLYLQHMIWHEGWHVGLIFLALRLAGEEPPQEWEEEKVWNEWRIETE